MNPHSTACLAKQFSPLLKTIGAKLRNIKELAARLITFIRRCEEICMGERDEDRVKSSRPIPSGRGVVALHTSTASGDYRGSPRCTWRLGGKAISWEKGAGVTRPTPWRTSEPLHAHARTCARGCTHAYARVEHVVTVVVGVHEGRLKGKG